MNNSKKIILVSGATGNQGSAVVKSLLQENKFAVRDLVRDKKSANAKATEDAGAELAEGDFDDIQSLEKALQNVYGVFSMQDFRDGADTEIRHGKALADAAKKTGVKHFIYSSVGSAERNTGIPHFESKFQIENYIKEIQLPYTIMRPVFFMYNYNGMKEMIEKGTLFMPLSSDKILQHLSEDDYGKMITKAFDNPGDFMHKEIEVASTVLTMQEVTNTFSDVLGKEILYQQIPFEDFAKQAGDEVTIMFRWFENIGYKADMPALEKTFFELSTLKNYLQHHEWSNQ